MGEGEAVTYALTIDQLVAFAQAGWPLALSDSDETRGRIRRILEHDLNVPPVAPELALPVDMRAGGPLEFPGAAPRHRAADAARIALALRRTGRYEAWDPSDFAELVGVLAAGAPLGETPRRIRSNGG
jgi:hypothetical protein